MMTALAERLLAHYAQLGCDIPHIGLLQPADPLLDTAGEDLRRRIYITTDQNGASLCLRPEFTIPVCLHHLARGDRRRRYGYAGEVFRQRRDEPGEFLQAGIEDIGNENRNDADAAAVRDCVESLRIGGMNEYSMVIGDQTLFEAILAALDLPPAWRKRLNRTFGDTRLLVDDIERLSGEEHRRLTDLPETVAAMVADGDPEALASWVRERMDRGGLPPTGGRSAAEIAARLLEKAELAAARLDSDKRAALDAFLSIETPLDRAGEEVDSALRRHGLDAGDALTRFGERLAELATAGADPGRSTYRASFGRRLDYYTGLVFEVYANDVRAVAGGGRYDRLMSLLGSKTAVPAVGFSIWLDRLERLQ